MSTSTPILNQKYIEKAIKVFKKTGQFFIERRTLLSSLVASIFADKAIAQSGFPVYAPAVLKPFNLDFYKFNSDSLGNKIKSFNLLDTDLDGDLDIFGILDSSGLNFPFLVINEGNKQFPKFSRNINLSPFGLENNTLSFDYITFNNIIDFDNDGDWDIIFSEADDYFSRILGLANMGSNQTPFFNPLPVNIGFGNYGVRCVIDYDNDGDLDIGLFPGISHDNFEDTAYFEHKKIFFLINSGIANNIDFNQVCINPNSIISAKNHDKFYGAVGDLIPVDFDSDGDKDLVGIGGYYTIKYTYGYINLKSLGFLFENNNNTEKFTKIESIETFNEIGFFNEFAYGGSVPTGNLSLSFGDLDSDGDQDIIYYNDYKEVDYINQSNFFFLENLGHINNRIIGTCFNDLNNDGMQQEAIEDGMVNVVLSFDKQGGTPHKGITITDTAGKFMFPALDGSYILKPIAPNYYTPAPLEVTINTADSNFVYERNFALKPHANIADLSCVITSGPTRPGFKVPYWLTYKNVGTKNLTGSLVYTKDSRLTYQTASQAPNSQAGNTLTWNFANIKPNESFTIYAEMLLSASANLGDSLTNILAILPSIGDQTPIDNQDTLKSNIVGSFDPNDKLVSPIGAGINGNIPIGNQPLEYTVRFQNTGTDTAFNVIVQDSLDLDFDWSTLKIMASSHEVTAAIRSNNKIKFTFDNILLPHKAASEPKSHGFVKYIIQPKVGLIAGTKFHNTANIYFDYNAPIVTNTTVNTFFVSTGVYDNINQSYRLFPNPMHQKAVLQFDNMHGETFVLKLMDATGKVVKTYTVEGNQATIERQDLSPGIYIFSLEGQKTQSAGKLVVE